MPLPLAALAVGALKYGPAIAAGLGSFFTGRSQSKQAAGDRQENRRQFDLQYGLQSRNQSRQDEEAARRTRGLARTGGARDQIMQRMMQRFGGGKPQPPAGGGY